MQTRFDYRTIRQLMLFAVVTQEKSIRKAAKRLNMSVPPLMLQLDELEARLRIKLLERTPRGVRLTPAGAALLPKVEQFISQAEVLSYLVSELREDASGVVTIGANAEAMLFWIPKLKARLAAVFPQISLFVKEVDSYQIETELTEGAVSIGVGIFETLSDRRLSMKLLTRERPIVMLGKSHPLSGQKHLQLKDLRAEGFVFSRRAVAPCLFDVLVRVCEDCCGFTPRILHEVESSFRQMAFASCGQGIAFLPESFQVWTPPNVVVRELADVKPAIPLSIAWNPLVASPVRDAVVSEFLGLAQTVP